MPCTPTGDQTPLTVAGHSLHIHQILQAFSRTDAGRYASVWLPLLTVAERAAPDQAARIQTARNHLQRQTASAMPSTAAEFDGVMQNFLHSFPGLQNMVQQILAGGGDGPSAGLAGVLNQVQSLMQPLLAQASDDPNAPDLRPAVNQIMQGFTGLTQALVSTATAGKEEEANAAPQVEMEEEN